MPHSAEEEEASSTLRAGELDTALGVSSYFGGRSVSCPRPSESHVRSTFQAVVEELTTRWKPEWDEELNQLHSPATIVKIMGLAGAGAWSAVGALEGRPAGSTLAAVVA